MRVKSGVGASNVTVSPWLIELLVPVIVNMELTSGVLPAVVTVSVVAPEPVMVGGLNDAEAPLGKPVAVKLTVPLNPFKAPTLIV